MQFNQQPLTIKSVKPDGFFCGYASVFNLVDQDNDVILPGAFLKSIANWQKRGALPKMLWQHDIKQPIGIWQEVFEDKYGLYVSGKLLLDLPLARNALSLMQAGAIDSLSVGFRNKKSRIDRKRNQRHIMEADLCEISLVTFPANDAARIVQRSASQSQLITAVKKLTQQIKSAT